MCDLIAFLALDLIHYHFLLKGAVVTVITCLTALSTRKSLIFDYECWNEVVNNH